jgi:hypothetical protein
MPAAAFELFSDGSTQINWDNTFKYSAAFRINDPDAALIADPNADDGNRNFRAGVISNRFDLLSELSIKTGNVGIEASAAAWYDSVYREENDNNSPATFNPVSVVYDRFTKQVRRLHGRDAELLNAFAYSTFNAGEMPVTVRVGRSTVLWGESLFFANNGVAAGMAPLDGIKASSVPGSRAKEVYMPVNQAWISFQPRPNLTVEAYYQFEWRKTRIPGAGSYFSAADVLDAGGERILLGGNLFFARGTDRSPPDTGQYGVAVRFTDANGDYGLYALRYHAKDPQIYLRLGPYIGPTTGASAPSGIARQAGYGYTPGTIGAVGSTTAFPPGFYGLYGDATTGQVGNYYLVYPRSIQLYGASYSGYVGDASFAAEISGRHNTPLVSRPLVLLPSTVVDAAHPLYAIGDSLHAQISTVIVLPQSRWWQGATFAAEVAANRRLGISLNPTAVDPLRTRSAVSMRVAFEPQYFSVLPGLDLTVPMTLGYGIAGRSSVDPSQNSRAGDFGVGIAATYRTVWRGQINFTTFFGPIDRQPFADRDFISITVQRTF